MVFLLLGLVLSGSAQAGLIYAVRVNALNAAKTCNYRTGDNSFSNYNLSTNDDSQTFQWVTQSNSTPYNLTNDTIPIMLFDLGSVQTINAIHIAPYSAANNNVKAMTVEFYDSPAINATPVYTQTFTNIPKSLTNLSLTTPANARFVKITMTENHGGDRYGIGNLMFDVAGGTPTSGSASVASYKNWPASNLLDLDTSSQWVTNVSTGGGYFNGTNPEPVLTFTYDTPQTISGIGVNPYNVAGNSVKDFNLKFYDASGAQISVDDPTQYNLTMTHYSSAALRDEFSFPAVANVSKIEMTLTSNFIAEVGSAGDRVGLSEVCFFVPTEPDAPTTPDKYNASMSNENVIVRPESASFLTVGAERASAKPLSNLFDGTESSPGGNEWYTTDTRVGSTVISDYYTVGYTPAIEFTMPEENMYNSFSIWGYGNKGNLMSDFTLELYDREGKLVYADEYLIDSYINKFLARTELLV